MVEEEAVPGKEVPNPYLMTEREYVDLLMDTNNKLHTYHHIMAQTLLDLNGPLRFSYMREGKKIVVVFDWENAQSIPAANDGPAVPPTNTIN